MSDMSGLSESECIDLFGSSDFNLMLDVALIEKEEEHKRNKEKYSRIEKYYMRSTSTCNTMN